MRVKVWPNKTEPVIEGRVVYEPGDEEGEELQDTTAASRLQLRIKPLFVPLPKLSACN